MKAKIISFDEVVERIKKAEMSKIFTLSTF